MIEVPFTDLMREICIELGRARCEAKDPFFRFNDSGYHHYNSDRAWPHILGASGELAFSRVFGTDLDIKIHSTGDEFDSGSAEIKTSAWSDDDIHLKVKVEEYERKHPKAYFLMRGFSDLSKVQLLGFVTRAKFDKLKRWSRYGHKPCWSLDASQLDSIEKLVELDRRLCAED